MKLRVVATEFGPPASVRLRHLVAEAKADDPLAPVTIIVPSNYVGVSVRRALARQQITSAGIGITGIDLITTYRLAELIGAPTLAAQNRRPVSNPVVAAAIRRVLSERNSMFSPVREHPSTERQLLRVHRELRDLDGAQLDQLLTQSDRASDVVAIHRATTALLASDWYDEFDLFATAQTLVAANSSLVDHRGRVIVYLPKVLTAAATGLLLKVARHTETVIVAGITGHARADTSARRLCGQLGTELPEHDISPPHGSRIVSVSDADDEVRTAIRDVIAALREGVPLDRMAIVHGATDPYARLLDEQLNAAGITHNGAAVQQIGHSVVGRTLQSLLALSDHQHSRADILALLSSAPIRQTGSDDGLTPTTEWERLSRAVGIIRGRSEWSSRLERLRLDAQDDLDSIDELDDRPDRQRRRNRAKRTLESATQLSDFVTELIDSTEPAAVPDSWADKCTWARKLLDRYLGGSRDGWPEAESGAADRVDAALDRLSGLSDIEEHPTFAVFRRALDVELEAALGRTGTFGDGVFIGHPGQLAGLDLDRVFVLGLAEGVYPARRHDDSLLPDSERAVLGDAIASVAGRLEDDHRDLLSALASAPSDRFLYFPRGDLRRSAERVPSRWLLDTASALSGSRVWSEGFAKTANDNSWAEEIPSFVAGIRDTPFPATDQEFESKRLISLQDNQGGGWVDLSNDELTKIEQSFASSVELIQARRSRRFTRFDGNLSAVEGGVVAGQEVISPTRLESWAFCPHQYFMRSILGIDTIDRPDEARRINALDRGTLAHEVLEEFVTTELSQHEVPAAGHPWSPEAKDRLLSIANRKCDLLEERGLVGRQLFWTRDRRSIVADVLTLLTKDPLRKTPGRVVAAELSFGLGDTAPIEHRLPDGRVVKFRGSADRIELEADGTLGVIDYKTGSDYSYKSIASRGGDKLVKGTKIQLPVYALAARRAHGQVDTPVHAYYWFVTRGAGYREIGYVVDDEVMERFDHIVATVLDGLEGAVFPPRPSGESYEFFVSCQYCDPDHLGTGARRREWERKRDDPALVSYRALAEPEPLLESSDG